MGKPTASGGDQDRSCSTKKKRPRLIPSINVTSPPLYYSTPDMASTYRDGPNPFRPYYIPPSIGPPPASTPSPPQYAANPHRPSFGTSARDILSDLPVDYSDYLDKSEALGFTGAAKKFIDQAVWNYTSVLLAQPFEVARIILQVKDARSGADITKEENRPASKRRNREDSHGKHREVSFLLC